DLAAAARLADARKNELKLEIDRNLLDVLGREVTSMVRVQNCRNAAHRPVRALFPPYRLPKSQSRLDRGGRGKRNGVACNCPAVIIENAGQPWFSGLSGIGDENIQLRMICLPDGIRRLGFAPVQQIKALAISLCPLVCECEQTGFKGADD